MRSDAQVDGVFLSYYLRSWQGRLLVRSLAQGSTRYNLSKGALLDAPIHLPTKQEQSAIAAVVTDMDADLAALEKRRAKTHAVKQAMMQELLTGKIRLVPPEGRPCQSNLAPNG
jgi:type I restriction enzyme S subunit